MKKRTHLIIILIVLSGLITTTPQSFAFSSLVGNVPPEHYDVHSRITQKAIDAYDFTYISYRVLVTGNVSHDYYPEFINRAQLHCDRNRKVKHADALFSCRKKFLMLFEQSKKYLKNNEVNQALLYLGRAFHIAQDFVSHSDIVDFKKEDQGLILEYFLGAQVLTLPKIKITSWDHKVHKGEDSNFLRGDLYSHGKYSKDLPKKNNESQLPALHSKKQTKFEAAFDLAVKITIKIMKNYKKSTTKEQWEKLKTKKFNL